MVLELVKIDAANIQNRGGCISGGQVQFKAVEDIDHNGGTITTAQGGSTLPSRAKVDIQSIGRIAGLYLCVSGQLG